MENISELKVEQWFSGIKDESSDFQTEGIEHSTLICQVESL